MQAKCKPERAGSRGGVPSGGGEYGEAVCVVNGGFFKQIATVIRKSTGSLRSYNASRSDAFIAGKLYGGFLNNRGSVE